MFWICDNGEWRPATADDLQNDRGTTRDIPEYRGEPNWRKRERQMTESAANYWQQPRHDALERLLWSQVNRHGVHG
jgi:hypothetical protein